MDCREARTVLRSPERRLGSNLNSRAPVLRYSSLGGSAQMYSRDTEQVSLNFSDQLDWTIAKIERPNLVIDWTSVQVERGRTDSGFYSLDLILMSVIKTKYRCSAPGASKRLIESKHSIIQKTSLFIYKASLHLDGGTRGEPENVSNSAGLLPIFEQGVARCLTPRQKRACVPPTPASTSLQPHHLFKGGRMRWWLLKVPRLKFS